MNNSITLTSHALQHLQNSLKTSPAETIGIRLSLRDAGCSGYAYVVDFAKQQEEGDQVFEFDGVKILIPETNFKALAGTEIDLIKQGVNSILQFNNPNVINACGCGESFQIKVEA